MLERTVAIKNEVLEPITFVLAYPTVHSFKRAVSRLAWLVACQRYILFNFFSKKDHVVNHAVIGWLLNSKARAQSQAYSM